MGKKPKPKPNEDERTEAETVKVRDATLKRMLGTKPKPFTPPAKKKGGKK